MVLGIPIWPVLVLAALLFQGKDVPSMRFDFEDDVPAGKAPAGLDPDHSRL